MWKLAIFLTSVIVTYIMETLCSKGGRHER